MTEKERYARYLCSREWGILKGQVNRRANGICERCLIHPLENVHHLTYQRKYHELLTDLIGMCRACHEFTHGISTYDQKAALLEQQAWAKDNEELQESLRYRSAARRLDMIYSKPGRDEEWDDLEEIKSLREIMKSEWRKGFESRQAEDDRESEERVKEIAMIKERLRKRKLNK